jgi:predicted DCC family thiol-disulfide oxidoreductase YuxK
MSDAISPATRKGLPDSAVRGATWRGDPAVPAFPEDRPIVVFDGHCVMCSGFARFILKRDRVGRYRLLPAQTPLGAALYRHLQLDPEHYETNILLEDGTAWLRSESSIRIFAGLGFPWSLADLLRVLPLAWRDRLYEWIARNRFNWFGRREACMLGLSGHEDRFLS